MSLIFLRRKGKRQAFLGLYEEGESVFFESFEEKWLLHKL
jgi:hypothetical protein